MTSRHKWILVLGVLGTLLACYLGSYLGIRHIDTDGDRMQVEIAASEHVNFLKNQITWRVVERVDGQPWLEKSVTLQDASSTVSPFVILN